MTERPQTPEAFIQHLAIVTGSVGNIEFGSDLQDHLNAQFPAGGPWYETALELCLKGCSEGWMCGREAGGIKFGRAIKAGDATHAMSVDVVEMTDVVGPHHGHPNGEIDLVMPLEDGAQFDGTDAGWKVYPAGSAHNPTVTGGKALVLYLLPDGAIEFTRA